MQKDPDLPGFLPLPSSPGAAIGRTLQEPAKTEYTVGVPDREEEGREGVRRHTWYLFNQQQSDLRKMR